MVVKPVSVIPNRSATKSPFSPRQAEIANMIVSGASGPEIANALNLSPRTVESHTAAIFNKLGVRSRVELTSALLRPNGIGAPSAPASFSHTNLPVRHTSLVGREIDIANVIGILRQTRLVTITGAAGVGKTRTALAAGDALLKEMTGGVWFAELAELSHGSSVEHATARALNIAEIANRPILETMLAHLESLSMILIFDNCEHVISESRALALAIVQACPQVRLIVTSREVLRIPGEHAYNLSPLRVPLSANAKRITVAEAAKYPAVELFTRRAQAIHHPFALNDENAPVIANICVRLDGIPLAIELAAAQVNVLTVQALLTRLDQRLRILKSTDGTVQQRHRSLAALMDSSYDLLSRATQELFEVLSVFVGGCTLAAVATACADGGIEELDALASISALIDKSLVAADLTRSEPRYRLLETSRHYAFEKLAIRGGATDATRRHATIFVELAERMEREHDIAPNSVWFTHAELELENCRAALEWTLRGRGDIELGQRLAAAMRPIWTHLSLAEGRTWIQYARDLTHGDTPAIVAANLDFAAACFAYLFGEHESALAANLLLIDTYGKLGQAQRAIRAQIMAGMMLVALGTPAQGYSLLHVALDEAGSIRNPRLIGLALEGVACACSALDDIDAARGHLNRALTIYDAMGAARYAAAAACNLADAEFRAGETDRALSLVTSSLATFHSLGDAIGAARGLNNLAAFQIADGDLESARTHAREALGLAKETQHEIYLAWSIQHVATVTALQAADRTDAFSQLEIAAKLLGYADSQIARLGSSRGYAEELGYNEALGALRRSMDVTDVLRLMNVGAAMTAAHAVETCANA